MKTQQTVASKTNSAQNEFDGLEWTPPDDFDIIEDDDEDFDEVEYQRTIDKFLKWLD